MKPTLDDKMFLVKQSRGRQAALLAEVVSGVSSYKLLFSGVYKVMVNPEA